MRMSGIILFLLSIASPLAAQNDPPCDELWFARNLIFDRAGYCFGSKLGRAVFDNADCTTTAPQFNARAAKNVAAIRAAETEYGCAVDTRRTRLSSSSDFEYHRDLQDLPVRDIYFGGCIGYRGAPIQLRTGASATAPVISRVTPGQSLGFSHQPWGEWTFVTIHPRDGSSLDLLGYGWAKLGPNRLICDVYPG